MSSARGRTVISSAAIRAAVNGDAQAIGSLSAHLDAAAGRMLSRLRVRSPGGRQVERDELRQEVMLRVVRHLPRFVGSSGGQLINWLRRIVENCHAQAVRDRLTHAASYPHICPLDASPDAVEVPDGHPQPWEEACSREELATLRRAIGSMPDADRRLIQLRMAEGPAFDKLAVRLDYPSAAAAESAWRRVIRRLASTIVGIRASAMERGASRS